MSDTVKNIGFGKHKPVPHKFENRKEWNTSDFLPLNEVLSAIIGASGSGKTSILLHFVTNISPKNLKWLYILTKIEGNAIYKSIEEYCKDNKINYIFESNLDDANKYVLPLIKQTPKNEQALVILDDWNNGGKCERTDPFTIFNNEIFTKARNWNCNMLFVVQSYTSISPLTRQNLNSLISFNIKDKHMIDALKKDVGSITQAIPAGLEDSTVEQLIQTIRQHKHSFFIMAPEVIGIFVYGQMDEIHKIKVSQID